MNKESFDRAKWMPIFIMGVLLIVIYKAFDSVAEIAAGIGQFIRIIAPLLFGILFTYFLYIPHKYIEKLLKKIRIKKFTFISDRARGISTILVFLLVLGFIGSILAFLLPLIFSSIADLIVAVPEYINEILRYFENLPPDSPFSTLNIADTIVENSGTIINTLLNFQGMEQAARGVANFASSIFNVLLGIFLSLYILLYRDSLKEYFTRLNNAVFKNEHRRETVGRYMSLINRVLLTFVASKGIDALCNFTAATLITTIFGVPYSILLGLMAGLFNFIPYIGSIVSSAIITLIAFLTCPIPVAIAVMISVFAFQQLDGNFIEPRIMKTSLKVNPILVIMGVVIGGAYFGIAGMFLAVPISVIIMQILQEYIASTEVVIDDDIRR